MHGFALAPELGLGFASNGRENKAAIVDLKTLKTIAKADTGENPDCILYVPGHQEVYTFNGRGQSATVFEAKTGKVIATIPLGGKPEFAVYDPAADRIYNNIEDQEHGRGHRRQDPHGGRRHGRWPRARKPRAWPST